MKKIFLSLTAALSLLLLTGCGPASSPAASPSDPSTPALSGPVDSPPWFATYRVVDGADSGTLLLAEYGGSGVFRLEVQDLEVDAPIEDGQLINIYFEDILETYPAQFGGVSKVEHTETARDDRCGLYLQVLEDLWNTDPGLNDDITELGVDLSQAGDLSESERAAVAWRFGELHGMVPLTGTWEELCDQGYIDEDLLIWEQGCLFTVKGTAESFSGEKWRSGLGAYFFLDCTGTGRGGVWSYAIGAEAIS